MKYIQTLILFVFPSCSEYVLVKVEAVGSGMAVRLMTLGDVANCGPPKTIVKPSKRHLEHANLPLLSVTKAEYHCLQSTHQSMPHLAKGTARSKG